MGDDQKATETMHFFEGGAEIGGINEQVFTSWMVKVPSILGTLNYLLFLLIISFEC